MKCEYWVMRALWVSTDNGRYPLVESMLTPEGRQSFRYCIDTGTLAIIPHGRIAEPVEVFDDEQQAHQHAAIMSAKYRGEEFRVIMTADVAV